MSTVDESPSHGVTFDPAPTGLGPGASEPMPMPGELHIKERRSWKTWQLLGAMLIALLLGFLLEYLANGSGGGSSPSSSAPAYTIPTGGSSGATATTAPSSSSSSKGSTTTTAAGGSTTTVPGSGSTTTTATAAGGSTTASSTAVPEPARVLMTSPQLTGNWTSPAFATSAAGWNIGWAFNCTPAPAAGPSFQVFVVPAGSSPTGTAAISETGASGQSVTSQSSLGSQTLVVQAPASCTWIVKVTGS